MASNSDQNGAPPASVIEAVLVKSNEMPVGSQKVEELDFNKFAGRQITVDDLISGMNNMGFQASSIGQAVKIINDMVSLPLILTRTFISSFSFSCSQFADPNSEHGETPKPTIKLPSSLATHPT